MEAVLRAISDPRRREIIRLVRRRELSAGEIEEVDRNPTRMGRQDTLRLSIEPIEVSGIEMFGRGERPQRRE